jgi:hypothetical protein
MEKRTEPTAAWSLHGPGCALHTPACPGGYACPYYAELLASRGEIGVPCGPGGLERHAQPHPIYGHMLRAPWWIALGPATRADRDTAA